MLRDDVLAKIASQRESLDRFHVKSLSVFGSVARGEARAESDVDLLVEFEPMEPYARVEAYFGLLDELRQLLNRDIDLVMVGAVKNPYIARDIERTKQLLVSSEPARPLVRRT